MKICSFCKLEKDLNEFRTRKTPYRESYVVARCRECERTFNNKQCDKKRKKVRERKRFSEPSRRSRKNEYQKQWRKDNIVKNRKYHRKHIKKHVDDISDSYIVRSHFKGFKVDNVPKNMIDSLREVIKVKRLLKNKKQQK